MTANAPASAMEPKPTSAIEELIAKSRAHYEACLDCCWSEDGEEARAELAALREENATLRAREKAMREALEDGFRSWSFNDWQGHTHSWHTKQDWMERHEVVREIARTALSPAAREASGTGGAEAK